MLFALLFATLALGDVEVMHPNPHYCPGSTASAIFTETAGTFEVTDAGLAMAKITAVDPAMVDRASAAVRGRPDRACCLDEDLAGDGPLVTGLVICAPESVTYVSRRPHYCPGSAVGSIFTHTAGSFEIRGAEVISKLHKGKFYQRAKRAANGDGSRMCCFEEDMSVDSGNARGDIICDPRPTPQRQGPVMKKMDVMSRTPFRCPGSTAAAIFTKVAGAYEVTDAGVVMASLMGSDADLLARGAQAVKGNDDVGCCLDEDLSSDDVERGVVRCEARGSPARVGRPARAGRRVMGLPIRR